MNDTFSILYVGPHWEGCTSRQRMEALADLGHKVDPIDTEPEGTARRHFLRRIVNRIAGPTDQTHLNESIIRAIGRSGYEILWLDKALTVESDTMNYAKQHGSLVVGYSPDDMSAKHNQSPQFLDHLGSYDIFFSTKTYGVAELRKLGCPRVEFVGNAYDRRTHRPMHVAPMLKSQLGGPVGFIGHYEKERSNSLLRLARAGVNVRVWGLDWWKMYRSHSHLTLERRPLWSLEYRQAINSFDINLGFLRKKNRDQQTQRSIEIPASGAFMLAERTEEHQELFHEAKEAEFFGSDDELIDKARFYIEHADLRQRIAQAGRERCLRSGYSNHDRLKEMIATVQVMMGRG